MSGIEVAAAMTILFAFAMGIAIGVVLIVSIASRREDRLYSLWDVAPDAACRGARRLMGVWVCGERPDRAFPGRDWDGSALGQEPYR